MFISNDFFCILMYTLSKDTLASNMLIKIKAKQPLPQILLLMVLSVAF